MVSEDELHKSKVLIQEMKDLNWQAKGPPPPMITKPQLKLFNNPKGQWIQIGT